MNFDPVSLATFLALLGLAPLIVIATTSFLKIVVVMLMLRNALGVQQIPPNMALYSMAMILTVYIMAPVGNKMYQAAVSNQMPTEQNVTVLVSTLKAGIEPLRAFMSRHTRVEQKDFFVRTARKLWGAELSADLKADDMLVLIPAFMVTELTAAFQMGFLIFLPFVIIDLIVSNILVAMGMTMMSPTTISLPLKVFLFVMVNGWMRLIEGLVYSYI